MLTIARKIEIAEAVMNDPRLGIHRIGFVTLGICSIIRAIEPDNGGVMDELRIFYKEMTGLKPIGYWFTILGPQARTERIEFLKKHIEHLKKDL